MKKSEDATPKYLLRSMREKQGLTQEELAEEIGTTCVTVSRWENGLTFPSRYFRKKLSILYGKSIEELGLLPEGSNAQTAESLQSAELPDAKDAMPNALNTDAQVFVRSGSVFLFNEPLPKAEELYGRRRERETLLNRTFRKASTSIVGPRRSGKTWLVQYLLYVAPHELGSRFCIKYLDATMPGCSTITGFVNEVLEEFDLPASKSQQGLIALEKGLKILKTKNIVPVLCIDEFEGFGNRQEFTLDFFRALRAMTQKFNLVLVIVTRSPLKNVVAKDVETSGFFNIFEQFSLEPFTMQEAEEFILTKGRQASFEQQEYEYMWKYGEESEQKWPPLRLQLVGKMVLEEKGQGGDDPFYWQKFEQRLENVYRGVMY